MSATSPPRRYLPDTLTPPPAAAALRGYGAGDPEDGDRLGDGLSAGRVVDGDTLGVAKELVGVTDGLAVRDGLGDSAGLGADWVGVGLGDGFTADGDVPADGVGGRTR